MKIFPVAALGALLAIAACGGGGGGQPAPAPPVILTSGGLDTSYGVAGMVTFPPRADWAALAVVPDGSAFVTSGEAQRGIVMLDSRGDPVDSYGGGGRVAIASSRPVLDAAGNLYVISEGGIARIDAMGQLDSSFGAGGRVTVGSFGVGFNVFMDLARDGAGNLYLAGRASDDAAVWRMAVAKFDREGRVVSAFGAGGIRVIDSVAASLWALAVDGQGQVYLTGYGNDLKSQVVAKLDANGNLVGEFGAGGVRVLSCDPLGGGMMPIVLDASGNLLLGYNCPHASILKLDSRGNIVASFRESGTRTKLFGADSTGDERSSVWSLLIGANGSIYAGGSRGCHNDVIAKVDASGEPARSFGQDGVMVLDLGGTTARYLALDGQGRLYEGATSNAFCGPSRPENASFIVFRVGA